MDADFELFGHGNLDLRVFARRAKDADAFDPAFRTDDRKLFFAGVLAGLGKVGMFGELMAFAEQRFDVLLRQVNVVGRNFDQERILFVRIQHARDV